MQLIPRDVEGIGRTGNRSPLSHTQGKSHPFSPSREHGSEGPSQNRTLTSTFKAIRVARIVDRPIVAS